MTKLEKLRLAGKLESTDVNDGLSQHVDFFQSITEMIPDLISVVEIPSRKIVYTNRDTIAFHDFNPNEIIQMSNEKGVSLFHPHDLPVILTFYKHLEQLRDNQMSKVEYRLKNKAGEWVTFSLRAKVFSRNAEGMVNQALFVGQDITEHKFTAQKLHRMENRRRKELFQVILRTQELERRRISESLHNGLGQLLYGIKLSIAHLLSDQVLRHDDNFGREKVYTDELLTKAIEETRKISHELMPGMLQGQGLRSAIMDVCKQMGEGIKLDYNLSGLHQKLDEYLELAIYRIIQELLVNVMKHAQASAAFLQLKIGKKKIFIAVSDNGKGINLAQQTKPGIGLSSIRNKVELLNGSLQITSVKTGGTLIRINIPHQVQC